MTKTNTKKIFAAVMVATMLASMSTGVFAKSPSDSEMQARAAICTECGSGEMVLRREYGPWETVGFDACIHGDPTKRDTIQGKEKSGKSMYVQIPDVVLLSRVEHIQKLAVCIDKRGSHENIDSSVCSCTDVFCVFFR